MARHGWQVKPGGPARELLTSVLAALGDLSQDDLLASPTRTPRPPSRSPRPT